MYCAMRTWMSAGRLANMSRSPAGAAGGAGGAATAEVPDERRPAGRVPDGRDTLGRGTPPDTLGAVWGALSAPAMRLCIALRPCVD